MNPGSDGRSTWLIAGQELLRRGGVISVKLAALTKEIGLTTGSFYHHFEGMDDYRRQLARFYGADQVERYLRQAYDSDPRQRLRNLGVMALSERMVPLDLAMRDWAGSNEAAASSVRSADAHLMEFIEKAFLDMGYETDEARARTVLLLSAGVARVMPPWEQGAVEAAMILKILAP